MVNPNSPNNCRPCNNAYISLELQHMPIKGLNFQFNSFNKQMTGISRDLWVMNKNKHIEYIQSVTKCSDLIC